MSSTRRGESPLGQHKGPYYSRYTEHKFAFNYQSSTDETLVPTGSPNLLSPTRIAADFHFGSFRHNSIDASYVGRCGYSDPQGCLPADGIDQSIPVCRPNSTDGPLSPLRVSPSEFSPVSPNFNVYDHPLSAFRSSSFEGSRSVSPHIIGSADSAKDRRSAFIEKNTAINNLKPKGKLANILSKHSVTIFAAAAALKVAQGKNKKEKLTHSCPDLLSEGQTTKQCDKCKTKAASHSDLESITKDNRHDHSGNNLKVPDIFTTSFTHSKKKPAVSPPSERSTISLQDIPEATRNSNKVLRRTISLTRADPGQLKLCDLLPPTMYRDDHVAQITDYLFIGSVEAAYNERKLCRLEVESLVDICNVGEMQIPSDKKTQCPCLCQMEFKHFRSRLIIAVADEENDGIDQYFEEVNRFVEGARRCSKKVLIYSYEGKSRAALFAIQYLMSYEGLLLRQAYNMVKKQRPQVSLNPSFQRTLEKLEKATFPDEKHSVNICNEYLNVADPQAIKCAWIDC